MQKPSKVLDSVSKKSFTQSLKEFMDQISKDSWNNPILSQVHTKANIYADMTT